MVDEPRAAVELAHLISVPTWITRTSLALDPRWDPLRGREDFQRLVDDADGGSG